MKIGLVGSGGREHALAKAVIQNNHWDTLYSFSSHRNPGIETLSTLFFQGDLTNIEGMVKFFKDHGVETVIVGPEAPLILGICNLLRQNGIKAVGPTKMQARLEGDKIFMRELLLRHNINGSPQWRNVNHIKDVKEFISKIGEIAIKPAGLTGGKGVRVMGVHFSTIEEAVKEVETFLSKNKDVLLEERLVGEEFSRMAFVSNHILAPMPVAQDFKYAFDGDSGGMTGGMGAYTMPNGSLPFLNQDDLAQADSIMQATIHALEKETGEEYRGFLYGQFMATEKGIRVIEFNVRLGDPEAINIMCLLQNDAAILLDCVANGKLNRDDVKFTSKASLCKYLVPVSYPHEKGANAEIFFDRTEVEKAGFSIIFASIEPLGSGFRTLGSRVVAISGTGDNLFDLSSRMESLLLKIEPPSLRHRKDIGSELIIKKKIENMQKIRNVKVP